MLGFPTAPAIPIGPVTWEKSDLNINYFPQKVCQAKSGLF